MRKRTKMGLWLLLWVVVFGSVVFLRRLGGGDRDLIGASISKRSDPLASVRGLRPGGC
jgi:hypothetical protein